MKSLALLLALALAAPAAAQTSPTPGRRTAGRSAAATSAPALVPGRGTRVLGSDLSLTPRTLQRRPVTATSRYERTFDEGVAECRRACAPSYYACATSDEPGACATQWSGCQARCATPELPN